MLAAQDDKMKKKKNRVDSMHTCKEIFDLFHASAQQKKISKKYKNFNVTGRE